MADVLCVHYLSFINSLSLCPKGKFGEQNISYLKRVLRFIQAQLPQGSKAMLL